MASVGAVVAVAAGLGIGVAAERKGVRTPGGELGRAAGVDVSGGAVGKDGLPLLPEVLEVDTSIDEAAVGEARAAEADRLRKRRGRASTITKKTPGLLGAQTTGGLLGN